MNWLKRRIADAKEDPDQNLYLYDIHPLGRPTHVYWTRRGKWALGLDVCPEAFILGFGKLAVVIGKHPAHIYQDDSR